jgi:transposase
MTPDHGEILAWILSLPSPVRVVYEAGPTGFGMARFLLVSGIGTVVAAPSKLQRPSGDRVKTDANDALHSVRLLKLGEVTGVRIPSADEEAARDLLRSREDVRGDLMRSRHWISKLLLRQGIVYVGGRARTGTPANSPAVVVTGHRHPSDGGELPNIVALWYESRQRVASLEGPGQCLTRTSLP